MCKKLISLILVCSLSISFVGCKKSSKSDNQTKSETPQIVVENNTNETSSENNDLELLGEVNVDKELFDVKLTIPKEYAEGETQESLDKACKENGWKSATLNVDGSVTYEMSKKQHKKMMDDLTDQFQAELDKMCNGEDYPNFVSIKGEDNFTKYTIVTKADKCEGFEAFALIGLYMYTAMYNIFNGTIDDYDNVHVDFVNEATGQVVDTADSKDMGDN